MSGMKKAGISPSRGDVHVNRPLTNISVAFMQDASAFVAGEVFPNVPVEKQADAYFYFDIGEFYRDEMAKRAPGTESAGSGYAVATDTYYADVWALHKDIHDQIRSNTDNPLNQDREATVYLSRQGMINRERQWVDGYFKGGVWNLEADGAASNSSTQVDGSFVKGSTSHDANNNITYWNDGASTPIEDIRWFKRVMLQRTGYKPNTLTLGKAVYDALLDHPDIVGRVDRGQTSSAAVVLMQNLAALFELDRILVSEAVWNSNPLGEDENLAFIAGKHALLSYTPATPGLMTPAAGYTFSWTGFLGASEGGVRMKRFRMEALESDRVEIQSAYDHKVTSADLGFFMDGIVE